MQCPKCGYIEGAKPRSLRQNRAYFGIAVKIIAEHLGYDTEDMHKALAGEFLGYNEVKIKGRTVLIPKSTKSLSTKEFMAYAERIQRWAIQEYKINVPSPNEPPLKD